MKSPKEIIDELFAEARAKDASKFKNIEAEAKFLKMSVGHLSRIKNQRVALSDAVIDRIAKAFTAASDDAAAYTRLKRELTVSRDAFAVTKRVTPVKEFSVARGAVSEFFARYSGPDHLLCCEYRDRPQIDNIRGAFPEVANDAARAVAAGMAYAFFQPFGKPERIADLISECVARGEDPVGLRYLLDVAMEVRDAYRKVKQLAEEISDDIQIVLYEADREEIEVSGIQSRLFYVDFPDRVKKQRDRKIYQWISGIDNHYFIERDKETIAVGAVAQQFLPIPNYWSETKRLPATEEELRQAEQKCGGTIKWNIWTSYARTTKAR
jgi:hypothetical protein